MAELFRFLNSTVGLKIIMGLTGFGLVGFAVVHMVGNLQIFLGREVLNDYAALLKFNKEFLWLFRLSLLAMVVVHIACAIKLAVRNRGARKTGYAKGGWYGARLASVTMMISGTIVLAFVVFHIAHFTSLNVDPDYKYFAEPTKLGKAEGITEEEVSYERMKVNHDEWHRLEEGGFIRHDVYSMVIKGFSNPVISGFYVVSVVLLGFHLSHGISSMFRSLGLTSEVYRKPQEYLAMGLSAAIALGMAIVPLSVLLFLA